MAARQSKAPAAFLSYAHLDDEAHGGLISRLRERLAFAVSVAIGERFEIFQDRDGIAWGQHWPERLDEALGQALFLIPILTPAFFNSDYCRAELESFLELERRTGRKDLILPIYFYTARAFDQRSDDLAQILSRRQYRDWRELRRKPMDSPEIAHALEQLADEIEAAVHRPPPAPGAGEATRPAMPAGDPPAQPPALGPPAEHPIDLEPIERERRIARTVALRAAPALAARTVMRLRAGTVVYVTGRARGGGWLFIEGDDAELRGYLVEDAVEASAPAAAAPTTTTVRPASPAPPPPVPPDTQPPQPGRAFRDVDAPWCPELVVIPAGRFLMGSPEDEEGRYNDERPQHEVVIGSAFALGRYPVTFDEYDAFCAATSRDKPGDKGWGRGRRPVINVSWSGAQAYVTWLRKETGKPYRLPSEAEWEYACRAGTTARFFWGDDQDVGCRYANGADLTAKAKYPDWTVMNCEDGFVETAPVGSFEPNAFGLFDMSGNVWEWLEDRWHDSYKGAPADGSAWVKGTESARVVRGGSWIDQPRFLRSAYRYGIEPDDRIIILGFRVARMLTP